MCSSDLVDATDQPDAPTDISISREDPEPPPSGEGETVVIEVTVVDGQFYFNGVLASQYTLVKGNTYIFQQNNQNGNGHVLAISETEGGDAIDDLAYSYTNTNGITYNTSASNYKLYLVNYANFTSGFLFEITYTVPEDAPDTLYFFSSSSDVTGGVFTVSSGQTEPPEPPPDDPDALIINENELGAVIGNLTAIDEDAGDSHTFTLGGADADWFEIVDGKLKLKDDVSANFEAESTLYLTITVTDSTGLSFDKDIKVTIANVNEAPTAIALASTIVVENSAGQEIGQLTVTDEDQDDTYTYALTGADAEYFEVTAEGILKLRSDFAADYETQARLTVTVTATDAGGLSVSNTFTISVENVNEPVT